MTQAELADWPDETLAADLRNALNISECLQNELQRRGFTVSVQMIWEAGRESDAPADVGVRIHQTTTVEL